MNRKERARMMVMAGVSEQKLTLVQAADLMAEPPRGGDHPDFAPQSRFDTASTRFLDHHDQGALHRGRSII